MTQYDKDVKEAIEAIERGVLEADQDLLSDAMVANATAMHLGINTEDDFVHQAYH